MPTAVVTGANSGIGHALAKLLVKEGWNVIGADLRVDGPIKDIGCQVQQLDIAKPDAISSFKDRIGDEPIHLLLNVAGIMTPHANDTLETVNHEALLQNFQINTFGPILLTQALLPNVLKANHPRIAVMSSRMGSVADNLSGGQYSYRSSKAAVNSLFKSLAMDLKHENVAVILLHPGIVATNLGGSAEEAKVAVQSDQAAGELWRVLMSKGMESTGRWFHRNGDELPW